MKSNKSGQNQETNNNGISIIDITSEEFELLLERTRKKELTNDDYPLLLNILEGYFLVIQLLNDSKTSIKRLKRLFFQKSEKSKDILSEKTIGTGDSYNPPENHTTETEDKEEVNSEENNKNKPEKEKRKGHGRIKADDYTGAEKIFIGLEGLKYRDWCPECNRGRLYRTRVCKVVRIFGSPPFKGKVFELEGFRCSACQTLFRAKLPEDAGKNKYDEEASSILATLKYGCGMPFHRLEWLQENLGIPLPCGTQWSLIKDLSAKIDPVYKKLLEIAAQGEIFYHDDTNIKVLSLIKENKELDEKKKKELENTKLEDKEPKKDRKGMFTTGILSVVKNNQIALYNTGRNHAGENLGELLEKRMMSRPPPIQMCDAAQRNEIKEDDKKEDNEPQTHLANCLAHARRKFVDLLETFPDESEHVIKQLGKVYGFEKDTRIDEMSPKQRLEYHIEHSKPIMDELKIWFENKFEQEEVEPNSNLGKAIKYMLNHWVKLTLFLKIERTPLDNNPCERSLKVAIRNRKNSLFYKTLIGANAGDIFMSIIQTCKLGGVNIFNYLTDIQKHQNEVIENTEAWLPWNYKKRFQDLR